MQSTFERERLAEGVHFSHVTDKKFNNNRISVSFITRLDAGKATENAVVPFILRLGSRTCPDFTALNRRLGLLYGAQLYGDVTKFGDKQILNVSIKGLDGRLALKGENMVASLAALLCDIVLDPYLEDGAFSAASTELEKKNLIDTILSEINDKRAYAQAQCLRVMYGSGARGVRAYGTPQRAAALTPQDAYAAYQRLVGEAQIELMFVGSGDYSPARALFAARFSALRRRPGGQDTAQGPCMAGLKEKTEFMDVAQSKLVLGFTCPAGGARDVYALRMLSAMYGGTPFSKLFMNVREKLSLCYYCSARYDRGNGIMLVSSGVEKDKRPAAQAEILRQLDALRQGDFTDEELTNTILALNTGFAATRDSLGALESWYLTQILAGTQNSPQAEMQEMGTVTRDEVVEAARRTELDAVYFLTSPGDGQAGDTKEQAGGKQ